MAPSEESQIIQNPFNLANGDYEKCTIERYIQDLIW